MEIVELINNIDKYIKNSLDNRGNNSLINATLHFKIMRVWARSILLRKINIVEYLIDKVDINYVNNSGNNALIYALCDIYKNKENDDIIKLLLNNR